MAKASPSNLCEAARAGDLNALKRAIQAGADLNAGQLANGSTGHAPLVLAAGQGHMECVRALLEAGAAVDARGWHGETAAMMAAASEHRDCLSALIEAGADVNARSLDGKTPAMWLAKFSAIEDSPCLRLLIAAGADLHPTDHHGRTAATHAKIGGKPWMCALIMRHIAALAESQKLSRALSKKGGRPASQALRM